MSEGSDIEGGIAPGTVLRGKYEVVRILGKGGMGVVLEARQPRMNRAVAIKVLLPAFRTQPDVVARFEREARAAAQLRDAHVARVLDVDALPDGSPFMVMELLRGEDLAARLARSGPMPWREAVGYLLEACAGMLEAHRAGIVHRDLKPGNLFLDGSGGATVLKILDFGISKITDDIAASVTQTAIAFGTPLYMSPEQVRSAKNVDARADIWSLGCVLYELLAGEPPFLAPTATAILAAIVADAPRPLGELRPDVPAPLAAAVMRALEKSPDARFPDVAAFALALAPHGSEGAGAAAGPAPFTAAPLDVAQAATAAPSARAVTGSAPPATGELPSTPGLRSYAPLAIGMSLAFVIGGAVLVAALRPRPAPAATAPPPVTAAATTAPASAGPVVVPGETAAPAASAASTASTASTAPAASPHASARPVVAAPERPSAPAPAPRPTARPASPEPPAAPRPAPPATLPTYL